MAATNKAQQKLDKALDRLEKAVARVADGRHKGAASDTALRQRVTTMRNRLDAAMGELRRVLED
jgi:septal ring factor EnvC (AmiA/AmiB activator)